jgi:acyl-coenzyme A thioesterase PaaI-like protein
MSGSLPLDLEPALTKVCDGVEGAQTAASSRWKLSETSLGPFGTAFGGVVAALLVDHARSLSAEPSIVAAANIAFLRSTALGEVSVVADVVSRGRRTTPITVSLHQRGQVTAQARVILASIQPIEGLPKPRQANASLTAPEQLPSPERPRPHGVGKWSGDLLEARLDRDAGICWFARRDHRLLPVGASAFAVAMADYAAGVSRPDSWEAPVVKPFPNPTLSVSLVREPAGPWIGLRARSLWSETGLGASHTELIDRDGVVGFAGMSCLLMPLDGLPLNRGSQGAS